MLWSTISIKYLDNVVSGSYSDTVTIRMKGHSVHKPSSENTVCSKFKHTIPPTHTSHTHSHPPTPHTHTQSTPLTLRAHRRSAHSPCWYGPRVALFCHHSPREWGDHLVRTWHYGPNYCAHSTWTDTSDDWHSTPAQRLHDSWFHPRFIGWGGGRNTMLMIAWQKMLAYNLTPD